MNIAFCALGNSINFDLIAAGVRNLGHQATFVLPSNAPSILEEYTLGEQPDREAQDAGARGSGIIRLPFPLHPWNPYRYWSQARNLSAFLATFDLVVCTFLSVVWGARSGKPLVFYSGGDDLNEWNRTSVTRHWIARLREIMVKRMIVSAALRADLSVIAPYQELLAASLGFHRLAVLPHLFDPAVFSINEQAERGARELRSRLGSRRIFFSPTRQKWTDPRQPCTKRNDLMLLAFRQFLDSGAETAKLVLVERGEDTGPTKSRVRQLHLTDHVVWIRPVRRTELASWYLAADLVLDQFGSPVFTNVAVEAMAMGTPVCSHVERLPMGTDTPPESILFQAAAPPEIAEAMRSVASPGRNHPIGREGRRWIIHHCHPERSVPVHVTAYQKALEHRVRRFELNPASVQVQSQVEIR